VTARTWRAVRLHLTAYGFLALALLVLLVFRIWPIVEAFRTSLTDLNILSGLQRPVGLENYRRALADADFHNSLIVTVKYVLLRVPAQTVLALALALLLQRPLRAIGLLRGATFLPVVTSLVIASALWSLIYHPTGGLLNSLLNAFGLPAQFMLGNPSQALPAVTLVTIWKEVGFTAIIFLAGLQGIPQEFYEAARTDGASPWALFRWITLPLLKRTTIFVVVITTVFSFQVYTPVYMMTKGGPLDSTKVVVYYIWEQAFAFLEAGYASALSMILLAIVLLVALAQLRVTRSDLEY
jgi:multiple sugar transport system permease protein